MFRIIRLSVSYYQKHLFFCTNQKSNGKKCCQDHDAGTMYDYTKASLKAKGLLGTGLCRANVTSCLGRCEEGPCLVVYPEGVWYTYQTTVDLDEIIETHVKGDGLVDRLLLDVKPEIQV